jgi:carbon monoxide dehydrogenase subunit G
MKLQNEFTVDAPLDRTWEVLLDIQRVAGCLPGATMEDAGADGIHHGSMKVKLGPITTTYQGTARLADVDEDTHTARIAVDAREQKGQGTASALITNRLERRNGGTLVTAETELSITGRPAQFGRGIMEDVAGTMLGEFARRLEREVVEGEVGAAQPLAPRLAPGTPPRQGDVEALDLGQALAGSMMPRLVAGAAVAVAVGVGLGFALASRRRPRRGFSIEIKRP